MSLINYLLSVSTKLKNIGGFGVIKYPVRTVKLESVLAKDAGWPNEVSPVPRGGWSHRLSPERRSARPLLENRCIVSGVW